MFNKAAGNLFTKVVHKAKLNTLPKRNYVRRRRDVGPRSSRGFFRDPFRSWPGAMGTFSPFISGGFGPGFVSPFDVTAFSPFDVDLWDTTDIFDEFDFMTDLATAEALATTPLLGAGFGFPSALSGITAPALAGSSALTSPAFMGRGVIGFPIDITETDDAYLLTADLPGLKKEDIKIKVRDKNRLVITAEQKRERVEGESDQPTYRERFVGKYQRQLRLPENVDPNAIEAEYKDGVLNLKLTKKEPSKETKVIELK